MAERPLCMRKAQGSNPCSSTTTTHNSVAQWIAYQTSNLGVAGSSPVGVVHGLTVQSPPQEDVFCHVSSIMDGNALAEGARVTYLKVFDDRRGKDRANQVRGGYGGGGYGGGGGS